MQPALAAETEPQNGVEFVENGKNAIVTIAQASFSVAKTTNPEISRALRCTGTYVFLTEGYLFSFCNITLQMVDQTRMIDQKQDKQISRKKRNNNYVDASVQGSLLRRIVYHWVIFFGVAGLSAILVQALLGDPRLSLSTRIQSAAEEYAFFVLVVFAIFPAFLLDTIRFSNRFVGPIVRLRRQLRELGTRGDTPSMKFREDDFWMEISSEFNTVRNVVLEQQIEIDNLRTKLAEQPEPVAEDDYTTYHQD